MEFDTNYTYNMAEWFYDVTAQCTSCIEPQPLE